MPLHFEGTGKNQVSQPGKFSYKSKYFMFGTNIFKDMCVEVMVGKTEGKRQHG